MREIDPIREPSEALLSSALHRLASAGDRSAPPELGASLAAKFRRHHRRRRLARLAIVSAIAACLVLLAGVARMLRPVHTAQKLAPEQHRQQSPAVSTVGTPKSSENPEPRHFQTQEKLRAAAPATQSRDEDGFITLPSYDPTIASEELQLVRVEITGSDLRMLGANVTGDLSDRPVVADFITGRDGTPFAVRLVQ